MLTALLLNCQRATLLAEQRAARLPPRLRGQLWLHLRLCAHCRRYVRQSRFIARQARAAAEVAAAAGRLPAAARQRLQALLDAHQE